MRLLTDRARDGNSHKKCANRRRDAQVLRNPGDQQHGTEDLSRTTSSDWCEMNELSEFPNRVAMKSTTRTVVQAIPTETRIFVESPPAMSTATRGR